MENASKALIIAGAILLAILIISLGLIVYNQAKETVGSVNLSQQEIEAFNAKFTPFEGTNVSGSRVNQLIQTIMASNQQAINDNTGAYVNFVYQPEGRTVNTSSCQIVGVSSNGKFWYYCGGDTLLNNGVDWIIGLDIDKDNNEGGVFSQDASYEPFGMLRVVQGKNYEVTMGYKKGRIARNSDKKNKLKSRRKKLWKTRVKH